jgi:hypothetical protein
MPLLFMNYETAAVCVLFRCLCVFGWSVFVCECLCVCVCVCVCMCVWEKRWGLNQVIG